MIKYLKLLTLPCSLSMLFIACSDSKYPGYEKNDNGLYYQFYKRNESGKPAQEGDVLFVKLIYKTQNDSTLFNSETQGRSIPIPLSKPTFKGGLEEGFAMLTPGDSASFIVSADSLYAKTFGVKELPKEVAKGSVIKFYLRVDSIMTKAKIEKIKAERAAQATAEREMYKAKEKPDLDKYLTDNHISTKPTESGLIYIEKTKGKGPQAAAGKKVKVNYTGRLIDGTIFDTNNEQVAQDNNLYNQQRPYEPIEFTVGTGEVIPGWDEALLLMKEGGKAQLIIPSNLAYGEMGQGPISPFQTLLFDVELVKVADK